MSNQDEDLLLSHDERSAAACLVVAVFPADSGGHKHHRAALAVVR